MTPLLLLHGATGSTGQFDPLKKYLSGSFDIHAINFYGHGGDRTSDKPFSIAGFAEQAASFIERLQLKEPVNIFGYSMGGYVAMYMARHLNNAGRLITLGTKFHWDTSVAAKECKMLQPDIIEQKVPAFAEHLSERHGRESWKNVLNKTAEMLEQMGQTNPLGLTDYVHVPSASLIMLGDRDKMVTLEETIAVYKSLPNAQLAVLPATPHSIEQADSSMIAYHIKKFIGIE